MSVDNLDHHYKPIYTMFCHLSNVMIIEPTHTTTVVSIVSDRSTVTSAPTDRDLVVVSYILLLLFATSLMSSTK